MEFNEKELQLIITALLKMPAEYSFDLLYKIKTFMETQNEKE